MYTTISKHLLILVLMLLCRMSTLAQLGNPFIQSFPPTDYQSNSYISSPQNWGMVQDNRGIMYISNTSGVLEYDGITWQLVKGTAYEGRFHLARNSEGRVFVGSTTDLGYLAPDSSGKMEFVSLLPYLKGKHPDMRVKRVVAVGSDVYFVTENRLLRWTGNHFRIWRSKAGFSRVFSNHHRLYVIEKEKGLCLLDQEKFTMLPGGKAFIDFNVVALLPLPATGSSSRNFLVVTFEDGLYTYKDHELEKLNTTPDHVLSQSYFMHGVALIDGTFALATTGEGIVVIDQAGRVKKVIDKNIGLNDNTVIALYKDQEGGLWAGLNKGISRIDYPSPVSFLDETTGLEGIVLELLKKGALLYAGTSSGLFVANEQDPIPRFKKLPELQNEIWKLLPVGDTLLIVSSTGVFALDGKALKQVSPQTEGIVYKTVHRSTSNRNRFYVGTTDGLSRFTMRQGKWVWEGKIEGLNHEVLWLAQDKAGKLWATCDYTISMIADAKDYGLRPPIRKFKLSEPMVENLNLFQVHALKGEIYFGTSKGVYTLKQKGKYYQLLPDTTFGRKFADGSREAINMTEDRSGQVWLTSEFRTGALRKEPDNTYSWDTIPLSRVPRVDVWVIHPDSDGVVWLGTTEGIFRYNPYVPKNYKNRQNTVLRKVNLLGDSTVFHGAFSQQGAATITQTPQFKFTLPHNIKSISFEYSATSYDAPEQLMYSYMLEGEDEKWSHWTSETKKEFTGLHEGTYVFKVKSRNIFGTENQASTFTFVSMPPFYRTWWAYTLYVIFYGVLIWGIVKIKHRHLISSKKSLEKVVHERTAQLEEEKKKSDDLLLNILPAETAEELKANGRALARSYDCVTVLFTDFKDFTQISEHLTPEELVAVIDFYFCAFDRIISKYNIEKIKTIGDAYMCAGGIPNPEANTPTDVVMAGLEILQFVQNLSPDNKQLKKHKFEIRIGIHTGPVVAGIVGTTKFAYDIWGDTVNTAARMESCGEEGKVNISGATYEIIKDDFKCTYRGKVDAKNKGDIDMYFVDAVIAHPVLIKSPI